MTTQVEFGDLITPLPISSDKIQNQPAGTGLALAMQSFPSDRAKGDRSTTDSKQRFFLFQRLFLKIDYYRRDTF
jgi:hypothetical protein